MDAAERDYSSDAMASLEAPSIREFEAGFFDYQARSAVRDLIRLHGPDTARSILAGILESEAERRTHA